MKFKLFKNIFVVVLFVIVVLAFSAAQTDSKKIEKLYTETQVSNSGSSTFLAERNMEIIQPSQVIKN